MIGLDRPGHKARDYPVVYLTFLEQIEPERKLYLAISDTTHTVIADSKAIQFLLRKYQVSLLVVNLEQKEVVAWIPN